MIIRRVLYVWEIPVSSIRKIKERVRCDLWDWPLNLGATSEEGETLPKITERQDIFLTWEHLPRIVCALVKLYHDFCVRSAASASSCNSAVGFQTSFVACMSSYNCPNCSADISRKRQTNNKGDTHKQQTFSNTVGSNFRPLNSSFGLRGSSSKYRFHWDRKPIMWSGLSTLWCLRNSNEMIMYVEHRSKYMNLVRPTCFHVVIAERTHVMG